MKEDDFEVISDSEIPSADAIEFVGATAKFTKEAPPAPEPPLEAKEEKKEEEAAELPTPIRRGLAAAVAAAKKARAHKDKLVAHKDDGLAVGGAVVAVALLAVVLAPARGPASPPAVAASTWKDEMIATLEDYVSGLEDDVSYLTGEVERLEVRHEAIIHDKDRQLDALSCEAQGKELRATHEVGNLSLRVAAAEEAWYDKAVEADEYKAKYADALGSLSILSRDAAAHLHTHDKNGTGALAADEAARVAHTALAEASRSCARKAERATARRRPLAPRRPSPRPRRPPPLPLTARPPRPSPP